MSVAIPNVGYPVMPQDNPARINRRPVNTVRDFNEAIAAAREAGARSVALFVRGETFTYYVTLPLEK